MKTVLVLDLLVISAVLLNGARAITLHRQHGNQNPVKRVAGMKVLGVKTGGLRCTDNNTGSGFIMYSQQYVNDRWQEDKAQADFRKHTAQNFVCVRYNNRKWEYDNNWADEAAELDRDSNVSWHVFIPRPTDILVAVADWSENPKGLHITNLKEAFNYTDFHGLKIGYAAGDLNFFPNEFISGHADVGEIRMNGTFIEPFSFVKAIWPDTTPRPPTVILKNGHMNRSIPTGSISCSDNNTGSGFIMYTQKPVNTRWSLDKTENDFRKHTASNFVCVRFNGQNWQYDSNWEDEKERASTESWHNFIPVLTDVLVAQVNYAADTVTDLKGANMTYKTIHGGYTDGDISFFPNQGWNGEADNGEFRLTGSYITLPPIPTPTTTTTTTTTVPGTTSTPVFFQSAPINGTKLVNRKIDAGEIACTGDNIHPGFIMYSLQDVHLRFFGASPKLHTSTNFVCVRMKNDKWQYDTKARDVMNLHQPSWLDFHPVPTDVCVAAVDFVKARARSLKGVRARSYGMQLGYSSGDLHFIRSKNIGDYKVWGRNFVSWGK
eukprot:TRINITY_DN3706_c0_g5_i1.p1 TRINITY_DN3706_c0_g5~~TRINITY_DN3706_c0_g5_i1.p1  ORF type:complete len:547 (-),score=72.12 TRINITY_DN3706_c0_g5_i1:94-1734(-)